MWEQMPRQHWTMFRDAPLHVFVLNIDKMGTLTTTIIIIVILSLIEDKILKCFWR